jgi:hypothetical protein
MISFNFTRLKLTLMQLRSFKLFTTAFLLFASMNTYATDNKVTLATTTLVTLPAKDTTIVDTTLFTKVDLEATFPGGEAGWRTFIETNLRADVPVRRKAPAGQYTVVVQFIVDKQGKLSDILPLTALGYGMEQEVVRVLRKSPKWLPAQMNGKPVKAYRKQPLTFVVSEVR